MSVNAGQLLWNRQQISVTAGSPLVVNTGLKQQSQAFGNSSVNEPPLDGSSVGSRVQVIPLPPTAAWATVTISEPTVDGSGNINVTFTNTAEAGTVVLNVLFWDPHTSIGPGQATKYAIVGPS